jgi:hypothetical protein
MALHALLYCERLFYLEEVEEIRIADEAVYAGRRLHEELASDEGEMVSLVLESERLGVKGKVDCLRRRNRVKGRMGLRLGRATGCKCMRTRCCWKSIWGFR